MLGLLFSLLGFSANVADNYTQKTNRSIDEALASKNGFVTYFSGGKEYLTGTTIQVYEDAYGVIRGVKDNRAYYNTRNEDVEIKNIQEKIKQNWRIKREFDDVLTVKIRDLYNVHSDLGRAIAREDVKDREFGCYDKLTGTKFDGMCIVEVNGMYEASEFSYYYCFYNPESRKFKLIRKFESCRIRDFYLIKDKIKAINEKLEYYHTHKKNCYVLSDPKYLTRLIVNSKDSKERIYNFYNQKKNDEIHNKIITSKSYDDLLEKITDDDMNYLLKLIEYKPERTVEELNHLIVENNIIDIGQIDLGNGIIKEFWKFDTNTAFFNLGIKLINTFSNYKCIDRYREELKDSDLLEINKDTLNYKEEKELIDKLNFVNVLYYIIVQKISIYFNEYIGVNPYQAKQRKEFFDKYVASNCHYEHYIEGNDF